MVVKVTKYLALGDSYTIGEGVSLEETWPFQLVHRLEAKGISWGEPVMVAKTGWTTSELWEAIGGKDLLPGYDWVSLAIGVNNQYRGWELEIYQRELTDLLKLAISLAQGHAERVWMLSIPDYSVTPFAAKMDTLKIQREIATYNSCAQEICENLQVDWWDITTLSRKQGKNRDYLAEDGLHPSGKAYGEWIDCIWEKAHNKMNIHEKDG